MRRALLAVTAVTLFSLGCEKPVAPTSPPPATPAPDGEADVHVDTGRPGGVDVQVNVDRGPGGPDVNVDVDRPSNP